MTETYKQDPPFCIQIEFTQGCNLHCEFCGLNGIQGPKPDYKFMTVEVAKRITDLIKQDGWNCRLEFAMHGEPSANPDMLELLSIFRKRLPRSIHMMMTSNGYGFMKDPTTTIDEALKYLNVLAIDWYENVQIVPKILERYKGVHIVHRYPQNQKTNPHHRRKPIDHDLVVIQDIVVATQGVHSTLNNHCGCGSPKNQKMQGKRCAKPFREMSIRWDGSVAICCNDWRGIYQCGNVMTMTLEEIWQSPAFAAARKKLYHGERTFDPCDGCDASSYRIGLLPDKLGKKTLEQATPEDDRVIREVLRQKCLTLPVLREWEKV